MPSRILEAYVGEYASGKSEVAINRALFLKGQGREVTLVDLDLVEPFYTLRPLKKKLMAMGLQVVAWETGETLGLGEAGMILKPELKWVLRRPGDIILDVGYGVSGAKTLALVEGLLADPNLRIYVVVNIARPMTATVQDIVEYVSSLGPVHGLVNNSHLGEETDEEIVLEGARVVAEAAQRLGLPVIATVVEEKLAPKFGSQDPLGHPIWPISRFMPQSFW